MTNKELRDTLESMEKVHQETSSSREKTLALLVEAGILTPEGTLTEPYTRTDECIR